MNKEKMTVHRALAELKTIDDRIAKAITSTTFSRSNKHSNTKIDGKTIDEYKADVRSAFDSVNDLIRRRNAMKRAVVLSNATTMVTIGDETIPVAVAIEMKQNGIDNYKLLMGQIASNANKALLDCDNRNGEKLEYNANDYVTNLFGTKDKANVEAIEQAKKLYIEANTWDFIDPIDSKKVVADLNDYIEKFTADVDAALSVSNAITTIEFEY